MDNTIFCGEGYSTKLRVYKSIPVMLWLLLRVCGYIKVYPWTRVLRTRSCLSQMSQCHNVTGVGVVWQVWQVWQMRRANYDFRTSGQVDEQAFGQVEMPSAALFDIAPKQSTAVGYSPYGSGYIKIYPWSCGVLSLWLRVYKSIPAMLWGRTLSFNSPSLFMGI